MRVQLKPGASTVKARPRRYDPVKTSWLASCVAALLAFGIVFRHLQAVDSSTAMAVPKKDLVRLVGDMLSRWVSVPALSVRAVAVFSPCDQDDYMPSKAVVRQAQQKASATDGTEVQSLESAVGLAVLDDEGLFRIHARGRHVLGIPDSDKQLQVRLMICAYMRDAGHRGVAATLVCLQEFCVWSGMEAQMRGFVRQCLHCADTFGRRCFLSAL